MDLCCVFVRVSDMEARPSPYVCRPHPVQFCVCRPSQSLQPLHQKPCQVTLFLSVSRRTSSAPVLKRHSGGTRCLKVSAGLPSSILPSSIQLIPSVNDRQSLKHNRHECHHAYFRFPTGLCTCTSMPTYIDPRATGLGQGPDQMFG